MEYYRDWDNDSSVLAYELGANFIIIGLTRLPEYMRE